jgi:glycosyltransferase involved in cell wall biosynthesis
VDCAKKVNLPVIVKIDDAVFEKASGLKAIQRRIEKSINTKTLKNATKILVVNEETKNLVSNYYRIPVEKISVVPNGVDINRFYSKNKPSNRIVFSGAMYYHRGLDILLGVAQEIIKKVPNVEFLLLGDGPELEKIKEIVNKKNLSKNVKFEGWVDRERIQDYLSECVIGIGPLRSTPVTKNALPIKVLEYMASYLPIIAWEQTLPSAVLVNGKNGFFVKNPVELSEKIIQLLIDQNMRLQMGVESRHMVEKFDWKNIAAMIIDEYNKCRASSL